MHPWHDVPLGEDPTVLFQCVVEIPRGSKTKYEVDKETGLLRLDRVLYSAVHYPANYGFLPRTYCEDGDPLDVLVLAQESVVPLCIVRARPIGVITMNDEKGKDDKIIAVAADDPEFNGYEEISQLPPHRLREVKRFLQDYKVLEKKAVNVDRIRGHRDATQAIRRAVKLYQRKILPRLSRRSESDGTGEGIQGG